MTANSILQNLNSAQKEAVAWPPDKPLLVLAGAGSGKTRILTRRLAYFILQGIPAFHIFGVTFTNKAAEEMRRRVRGLIRQEVWVNTFHSSCLRILREEAPQINLPRDFLIYDELDQLVLLKECLKEMNIPDKQVHPKGARELIQRAKDFLLSPYQFLEKATDDYEESVGRVYVRYEEKLNHLKGVDFGDLILKTVSLFDRNPKILTSWQERFQYILIDEYQDTNHAQYRLIKLLASKDQHLTVVGDPDQSIYGWRGADIRNILNFEQDYPQAGVIKMEQNYRSTTTILEAANALIQHNEFRKPKLLWGENGEGEPIALYEASDEKDEASFVVQEILAKQKAGRTLNEFAIFYRIHAQSRVFEDTLRKAKIPYKIVGGIRFYDRREIKDLIAYLRAVGFPQDEVSLKRILNVPARGIGKKAVEILEAFRRTHQLSFDEALHQVKGISELGARSAKAIHDFALILENLRKHRKKLSLRGLLEEIISCTGYVKSLEEERTIEAQARIENIEEFFSVVDDFEEDEKEPSLETFLESISLMTDIDTWDGSRDCLTLMTLHCAKGLEFPVVFMVGLETGIFPHLTSLGQGVDDEMEEERRLCYVGITRAREKLYLSYASSRRLYGHSAQNLPSKFLTEIPSGILESQAGLISQSGEEDDIEIDYNFSDES